MGQPLPGPRSMSLCSPGKQAQGSWEAGMGRPALGTAAVAQIGSILQEAMPSRCHIPLSLGHLVTVLALVPGSLRFRKTSSTWSLLTVKINPTPPASAEGRFEEAWFTVPRTFQVLETPPTKGLELMPCPCAYRPLKDWSSWTAIRGTPSKKLWGNCRMAGHSKVL